MENSFFLSFDVKFECVADTGDSLAVYTLREGLGLYRIGSEALSWSDAKIACERDGANLLVLNSEKEKNFTVQLYSSTPDPPGAAWQGFAWIGVHDLRTEGVFETVTGKKHCVYQVSSEISNSVRKITHACNIYS